MRRIAEGVWQLRVFPPHAINAYLAGDVLIDAATRWGQSPILSQLRNHVIRMVALTHCHPDHQGLAKVICEQRRIPLACHEADVPVMEGRAAMRPDNWLVRLGHRVWSGQPHRVDRVLREGDDVACFRVIHTPGHTPGHVIFFRDNDRVAIAGDLLANVNFLTWEERLAQPPWFFWLSAIHVGQTFLSGIKSLVLLADRNVCPTSIHKNGGDPFFSVDPAENRRSIRKLLQLNPSLVCFGHGPPLLDLRILKRFVARGPDFRFPDFRHGGGFSLLRSVASVKKGWRQYFSISKLARPNLKAKEPSHVPGAANSPSIHAD